MSNELVPIGGILPARRTKRYKIEYSSNNSGGSWWLGDEAWIALEKAGWNVDWARDRKGALGGGDSNGRWLGALATNAHCLVDAVDMVDAFRQAVDSWRTATGGNPGAEGCNCCGSPHSFSGETGTHGEEGWEESYLYDEDFRQVTYSDPW